MRYTFHKKRRYNRKTFKKGGMDPERNKNSIILPPMDKKYVAAALNRLTASQAVPPPYAPPSTRFQRKRTMKVKSKSPEATKQEKSSEEKANANIIALTSPVTRKSYMDVKEEENLTVDTAPPLHDNTNLENIPIPESTKDLYVSPLPQEKDIRYHVYDTIKQIFNFEDKQYRINRIYPFHHKDYNVSSMLGFSARSLKGLKYLIEITNNIEPLIDSNSYFDYLNIDSIMTLYANYFDKGYDVENYIRYDNFGHARSKNRQSDKKHFEKFDEFYNTVRQFLQNLYPTLNGIQLPKEISNLMILFDIHTPKATSVEILNCFNSYLFVNDVPWTLVLYFDIIKNKKLSIHISRTYDESLYYKILKTYYFSIEGTFYDKYISLRTIIFGTKGLSYGFYDYDDLRDYDDFQAIGIKYMPYNEKSLLLDELHKLRK